MNIVCAHCTSVNQVDEQHAGQTVPCAHCGTPMLVPRGQEIPPLSVYDLTSAPTPTYIGPGADHLTLDNLAWKPENTYFILAMLISSVVWILLVVLIFPVVIALLFVLFSWFANGLLIAHLRSEGVKVDASQMPGLHNALTEICAKLSIQNVPEMFVLESGGMLNAFAARHSGRHFVVIYSDILDAYGPDSAEARFLIGHELGHIQRNHIVKRLLAAPGLLFPLLGNAYSRACEVSCDRYGAFASGNVDGAIRALMVLSGGKDANKHMNPLAFADQYVAFRGFFVSWAELISGYPSLAQRTARLVALRQGRQFVKRSRNPMAYLFALFSIGGRGGGGVHILTTIAIIAILAAILVPAVQNAIAAGRAATCLNSLERADRAKIHAVSAGFADVGEDVPGTELLNQALNAHQPIECPDGGTYYFHQYGVGTECSIHGTLENPSRGRRSSPGQGPRPAYP